MGVRTCFLFTYNLVTVWCFLYFRQAFGIVDDFKSCISEIEFDDDTLVPVELMDPNVAGIYSKSSRAKVNIFTLIKYFC